MWLGAGAKAASKVDFADPAARKALERATLIWMPGGDQNRFMKAIDGTGLDDVIRSAYRKGAVVGGTSATAAILREKTLEVVGRSAVVVFDARGASVTKAAPGEVVAATNVKLSVLREGMTYDVK